MSSTRAMTAVLLAFVVGTGAIFVFLFGKTGSKVELTKPYTLNAEIPTAVSLSPTSDVRAAGVKIGAVRKVGLLPDGNAKITFSIDKAHAPLPRNSRLLVRTKTLLGENYLSIEPGTVAAGTLKSGDTIGLRQSDDAVQLDDILSVLDAPTRKRLRSDLRLTAGMVERRGSDLNTAFGSLAPTVRDAGTVTRLLDNQRADTHAVIRNTGLVLDSIAQRDQQLQQLVIAGKKTADTIQARDSALAASISAMPALLSQTKKTTQHLGRFADASTPTVNHLTDAAVALRPTVRDLEPAATDARRLFDRVPRLVKAADPLLQQLKKIATAASPLITDLKPLLSTLNPALRHLSRYSREAGSFFANVGASNNEYDALGAIIRVYPLVGPENFGLLDATNKAMFDKLLDATGVGRIRKLQSNPYPAPGTIGNPQPFDGKVPQLPSGK